MSRGQKSCPKCSHGMGPRTKVCPKCQYIFEHLKNPAKKEVLYDNGVIRQGKGKCSNCSVEYDSEDYKTDNYGTVTYVFRFGNYCSYSCVEDASSKKDSLILAILDKIEEVANTELTSFIEEQEEDSEFGPLIEDIFSRSESLKEDEEYRKTHPTIVLTSMPRKKQAATTPEECEEEGIKVPPKIGSHVSPEPEMNAFKAFLLHGKVDVPFDTEENEEESSEEEDSEEDESHASLQENNEEQLTEIQKYKLSMGLSIENTTPTITPKPVVVTQNNPTSSTYDNVTKPTQGQKKCGAKDRAKGLIVGCGKILGVRVAQCSCGYKFPPKV